MLELEIKPRALLLDVLWSWCKFPPILMHRALKSASITSHRLQSHSTSSAHSFQNDHFVFKCLCGVKLPSSAPSPVWHGLPGPAGSLCLQSDLALCTHEERDLVQANIGSESVRQFSPNWATTWLCRQAHSTLHGGESCAGRDALPGTQGCWQAGAKLPAARTMGFVPLGASLGRGSQGRARSTTGAHSGPWRADLAPFPKDPGASRSPTSSSTPMGRGTRWHGVACCAQHSGPVGVWQHGLSCIVSQVLGTSVGLVHKTLSYILEHSLHLQGREVMFPFI